MAESTKENRSLITGNLVKAILPSDDRKFKKIVLKINSKFAQIGYENKIIGLDIPHRAEADEIPYVRCLDLNNESESETSTIFIQALAVQLNLGGNELIEIEVNSNEASYLQIGDRCKIHLKDESKAEVNNEVHNPSAYRRELFVESRDVMTGPFTRSKRKRKPASKTVTCSKAKPTKQTRTAPIDCPECIELCHMFFEKVQKILTPLRDNGNWDLFDENWNELLVEYGDDAIWRALLVLEHGIRISYHSQFFCECQSSERKGDSPSRGNSWYLEEAEKTLHEGWKKIKTSKDINPSIKQFFQGRFYCYLTSVYRRNKLYGRAQECIDRAEQIFQNSPSTSFLYDKGTVFYEKGSWYHEFDTKGDDKKEAIESFEKCYELCQQLRRETGCDFIEKGQFALLKKVMVLLGCSTMQGRKRRITDEDLEEAKKCIDEIERENQKRHSIPVSEQLQLLLAKSDMYFRMQDYSQVEKLAHQAIDLADQQGFDSRPARNRLRDIQEYIEEPWPTQQNGKKGNVETVDQRASCDADGSGSQTTGISD